MTFTTAPNLIEQADFSSGWHPDQEEAAVPKEGLVDASNLLPDKATGTLQTRTGFTRMPGFAVPGYRVAAINPFQRLSTEGVEQRYIIAVLTNDTAATDNVRVYAYDLDTETLTQISTAGKEWVDTSGRHYGFTVDNVFYGGSPKDKMYSWDPERDPAYDDDASLKNFKILVPSSTSIGAGEVAKDRAFRKGHKVRYDPDGGVNYRAFGAVRDIRADARIWRDDTTYTRGDKVVHKGNWGYFRTYRCVAKHQSSASAKEPGMGADWKDYWKKRSLDWPVDDDGNVVDDWDEIPDAPITNVATFHQNRMFARHESEGKQILIFSAQAKMKKSDDLRWDPKDWVVDDEAGAGFEEFETADGDNITALLPGGYYLYVMKRHSAWVIAGHNPASWTKRMVSPNGCISRQAITHHEGLVYFVGDRGFYVTDGTSVEPAPGTDKINSWLRNAVRWDGENNIVLWSHNGLLWLSLPTDKDKDNNLVLAYDPHKEAFWPQHMGIQDVTIARQDGTDQLFFSQTSQVGELAEATYAWTSNPHRSTSTRTYGSGPTVETNLVPNPSFEAPGGFIFLWEATGASHYEITPEAARRGKTGLSLTANGPVGTYTGVESSFPDASTETHTFSVYARRRNWKKNTNPIGYSRVRLAINGNHLPEEDHTYEEVGNGWWRVSATYTGSLTPRNHGMFVLVGSKFQFDQAMCQEGAVLRPYFDGFGGAPEGKHTTIGGGTGLLMKFGTGNQDDSGDEDVTMNDIAWNARTSWFSFGVLREDRRIRRVWALVRGFGIKAILKPFRNYEDAPVSSGEKEVTTDSTNPVTHIDGKYVGDAHAIAWRVEGLEAPAAFLGVAADTQPRRVRYYN